MSFTREQAGRELRTPALSIKPQLSPVLPLPPHPIGTELSHAPNMLPPIATLSPTPTSLSPAHEPERMSIDRTATIDISAGAIRAERQVCRSDESRLDILSPPQMTVRPASGCTSEHPSDAASIFVPGGAKPAAAAPDDNADGDQYG
jgi:hypothetical protein